MTCPRWLEGERGAGVTCQGLHGDARGGGWGGLNPTYWSTWFVNHLCYPHGASNVFKIWSLFSCLFQSRSICGALLPHPIPDLAASPSPLTGERTATMCDDGWMRLHNIPSAATGDANATARWRDFSLHHSDLIESAVLPNLLLLLFNKTEPKCRHCCFTRS